MTINKHCDTCNKSALSLLLLRPSPIAKDRRLAPPGSDDVKADGADVAGLLPDRLPTESCFALRLLRAGYVHVFIEGPPPGVKNWQIYRVTEHADLVPLNSPGSTEMALTCLRSDHNATGLKLLTLPQAHKITDIWIAYSANLWNDALRARNKADPSVMQKISLAGGSPNTFAPTAANLKRKVLECALMKLSVNGATEHDFAFNSVAQQVDKLADNLTRAAACHPKTKGKELAVVLRDPVGIATELNALRLRRHELAKDEMAKPENAHPITSLQMLDGLRQSVMDTHAVDSYKKVSPLATRQKFESETWPEGTEWKPLTADDRQALVQAASSFWVRLLTPDYKKMFEHPGMGRVFYPDHEERVAEWVESTTAATFERYRKYINDTKIAEWKRKFEKKMQDEHGLPQARCEADWWAAREDAGFHDYFALHFDEADSGAAGAMHSPGTVYAKEVAQSLTPQPLALGDVQGKYVAELQREVKAPEAVMWRALVGNQTELLGFLQSYLTEERPDKLHDVSAGVFIAVRDRLDVHQVKYNWLLHGGYALSTLAITQSLSAAVSALGAASGAASDGAVNRLIGLLMGAQAMQMAGQSALQKTTLKVPVRVSVRVSTSQARALMRGRLEVATQELAAARSQTGPKASDAVRKAQAQVDNMPSNSRIKQLGKQSGGMVTLTLLSDNLELARFGGDLQAVIGAGGGTIAVGKTAQDGLRMTAGTLRVTESQFHRMLQTRPPVIANAVTLMRETALGTRGALLSLDGHVGLVAVLINGWGLHKNVQEAWGTTNWLAWSNTVDSFLGLAAGTAQIAEAAVSASMAHRLGHPLDELGPRHRHLAAGAYLAAVRLARCGQAGNRHGHATRGGVVSVEVTTTVALHQRAGTHAMSGQITALPELLTHGRHIRTKYEDGGWGQSTATERASGSLVGTLKRFAKDKQASGKPQALGWIKAIYEHAIEYSGMKQQLEGMIMVGAFFGLMVGAAGIVGGAYLAVMPFMSGNVDTPLWVYIFSLSLGGAMFCGALVFTAYIALMPLRRVWRSPRDLPIIFDRRRRKVYRMVQDVQPGLRGLLKPWPVKACEYEWDLIDAEHDAQLMGSTATAMRVHRLVFVVRKSVDDPTIIDHFEIGNGMSQSKELVAPMWEHIRRFMEESGPHLPHPTEPLDSRQDEKPSWWQACGQAGPFGSRYLWWWKEHPLMTLFLYHGVAGVGLAFCTIFLIKLGSVASLGFLMATWVILSMNWGQGTGIWLQAHTSRLFDWPDAVKQAIGTSTRRGTGW